MTGTSPALAVGLKLMVPGYSGPAMRVQRLSDNTQTDIRFTSSGAVDTSAILSFLGSSSTLGYVVKLYDQSGNKNDVTQANVTNAPTVSLNPATMITIGQTSFVTARSVITSTGNEAPAAGPGYWNLPTNFAVNLTSTSAVLAYSPDFSGGEGFEEFNLGGSSANPTSFNLVRHFGGLNGLLQGFQHIPFNSGFFARQQPTVLSLVTNPNAAAALYMDGVASTGLSGLQPTTLVGGTLLGGLNSQFSNATYANFLAFAVYTTTLTQSQVAAVSTLLIPRNIPNVNIVADGDSIAEGHCATNGRNTLRYAEANLSRAADITNIALGGTTTADRLPNISSPTVSGSNVGHLYKNSYGTNIYFLKLGTNDIHVKGLTGAATWTAIQTILTDAKSLGYKTVVATVMHEAGETATQSTEVNAYNALLRAAAKGPLVDAVADDDANSNLQLPTFANSYSCDGTHPNDAGYAIMGSIAATAINSLLP